MVEINNRSKYYIPIKKTKKLVEKFFKYYKDNSWNISIAIVGDKEIKEINNIYRGINKVTDVLSFDLGVVNNRKEGEIIINIEELRRKEKYKDVFFKLPSYQYLFNFILVHGLLHLLGYDDNTEDKRLEMLELGRKFLEQVKV